MGGILLVIEMQTILEQTLLYQHKRAQNHHQANPTCTSEIQLYTLIIVMVVVMAFTKIKY